MLNEPTITKLLAMRLNGMVEALEEQRKSSQTTSLSFEDRLALLVERQWLWKENRAMAVRLKFARLRQPACVEDIDYHHHRGLQRGIIEHLAGSDWLKYGQNCIITGPTGAAKLIWPVRWHRKPAGMVTARCTSIRPNCSGN